ncbi:hypothetical protein AB0759_22580 [Scytonema tolypothrichoides VB-61278_2]|uniref:Uncharacterized protein n=1 Tax=Scytonema tolypothrichoides VB-61278_2 TaxID=3232314 RepID=A0ABW8WQX7_9CYAN
MQKLRFTNAWRIATDTNNSQLSDIAEAALPRDSAIFTLARKSGKGILQHVRL